MCAIWWEKYDPDIFLGTHTHSIVADLCDAKLSPIEIFGASLFKFWKYGTAIFLTKSQAMGVKPARAGSIVPGSHWTTFHPGTQLIHSWKQEI